MEDSCPDFFEAKGDWPLSATNLHLPSTSTRIQSCATAHEQNLKEVQGGERKWGTLCSGKNWPNRSLDRHFQELILWAQFLYLLISRKALKSFIVTTVPCDQQKPSAKIRAWLHVLPVTKITHILTFPLYSLQQFLRVIWSAVSWTIVFILPQIKFDPQLSCAFFLKSTPCH